MHNIAKSEKSETLRFANEYLSLNGEMMNERDISGK
jgi:hypothetical protein